MTITVINIAFAASIALSAVCLVLLLIRDKTDGRRCTMPSLFGIISIANTAVWAFISSRTSDSLASESVFVIGLLLFFLLMGDVLSLSYIFNSVKFDDTGFIRRNFLGISRRYEYRDITEARKGRRSITLFFGRKKLAIPPELTISNHLLIYNMVSGYARYHGGADIPEKDDSGSFLGDKIDYEQGMSLIFVYILIFLLIVGIAFLPSKLSKPVGSDSPDIVTLNVVLSSCEYTRGNELELFADGMAEYFQIDSSDRKEAACGEIITAVKAGKSFGIAGVRYNDDDGNPYYDVRNLTLDGRVLISYDETNADDARVSRIAELVIIGFGVIWVLFCVEAVRVARNPENYSPRFRRIFFQDTVWKRGAE